MTLDKAQVKLIYDQFAAHNIYYEDLKHELTDHVASTIESRQGVDEYSLDLVIKDVITEINPGKVQMKRMLSSFLLPFKAFGQSHPLKTLSMLSITGLASYSSIGLFESLEAANKWLAIALMVLATLPALISLVDQKWKPYKMSFFMSAVIGCNNVIYGLYYISRFFFESYLEQSTNALVVFYSLGFGLIFMTYAAIYKQYKKVKQYVTSH